MTKLLLGFGPPYCVYFLPSPNCGPDCIAHTPTIHIPQRKTQRTYCHAARLIQNETQNSLSNLQQGEGGGGWLSCHGRALPKILGTLDNFPRAAEIAPLVLGIWGFLVVIFFCTEFSHLELPIIMIHITSIDLFNISNKKPQCVPTPRLLCYLTAMTQCHDGPWRSRGKSV